MKICRLIYYMPSPQKFGSISIHAYNLTKSQIRRGHKVKILAGMKYLFSSREKINGIMIQRLPTLAPNPFHLRIFPYGVISYYEIKKINPDLVHGHDWDMAIYSLLSKKLKRDIPFFLHAHGNQIRWLKCGALDFAFKKTPFKKRMIVKYTDYKFRFLWEKFAHRNADFIFTDCYALKNEVMEDFGVPSEKIHVVYNGVDVEQFKPGPSSVRERLDIPDDAVVFFQPTADVRKGVHITLKAFSLLEKRYKNIFLIILGGTEKYYKRIYGGLPSKVKIGERVSYNDISQYYNASDIVVLPTYYDTFAKILGETMACEKPIISTKVSGVPEIISDKEGLLINPGDYNQLVEAMSYLIDNPEVRKRMGKEGRRKVVDNFTWDKVAERVDEGYKIYFESR